MLIVEPGGKETSSSSSRTTTLTENPHFLTQRCVLLYVRGNLVDIMSRRIIQ